MTLTQTLQPPGLWDPAEHLFAQGVLVAAAPRTLYLAGQTAIDGQGQIVGAGDPAAQIECCFNNMDILLRAAGGRLADVVRLRAYFTDMRYLDLYTEILGRYLPDQRPSQTVVQVAALAMPELLVELEATAVLDAKEVA